MRVTRPFRAPDESSPGRPLLGCSWGPRHSLSPTEKGGAGRWYVNSAVRFLGRGSTRRTRSGAGHLRGGALGGGYGVGGGGSVGQVVIEAGPWAGVHPRVLGSTAICALRVKASVVPSVSCRVGRLGGLPLRHCVHSLKRWSARRLKSSPPLPGSCDNVLQLPDKTPRGGCSPRSFGLVRSGGSCLSVRHRHPPGHGPLHDRARGTCSIRWLSRRDTTSCTLR